MSRRFLLRQENGSLVNVELSREDFVIGEDLVEAARRCARQTGLAVEILAQQLEARDTADAEYRQWRARIVLQGAKSDEKFPEWKQKAVVEAEEEFLTHSKRIAVMEAGLGFLRDYLEVSRRMDSMLNLIAWIRERGREVSDSETRPTVPERVARVPAPHRVEQAAQRRADIREVFRKAREKRAREE